MHGLLVFVEAKLDQRERQLEHLHQHPILGDVGAMLTEHHVLPCKEMVLKALPKVLKAKVGPPRQAAWFLADSREGRRLVCRLIGGKDHAREIASDLI